MTNVTTDVRYGIKDGYNIASGFRTVNRTQAEHKSQAITQKGHTCQPRQTSGFARETGSLPQRLATANLKE
jgi:hypothetical protein